MVLRDKVLIPLATVLAFAPGLAAAQQQAAEADPLTAGPLGAPSVIHPKGGYLPQPPSSTQLLEKVWAPAAGFPLYVLNRECNGQCAVTFPPLTPADASAKPPSKDWTIRTRDENGALQWVYKGKPVYTFSGDKPDEAPKADDILPGIALARP